MVETAIGPSPSPSPSPSLRTSASTHLARPSLANAVRLTAVMERLNLYVSSDTGPGSDHLYGSGEFQNLCLSLSRGIDYAVANDEVPDMIQELLVLVKQLCQRKGDPSYQAVIMVLMVSIKNACKIGWFSERDTQELLNLVDKISSSFCSLEGINCGAGNSLSTLSTVIDRFYPQFKLGQMLATLEIKPGYGAFLSDFHISKRTPHSRSDKIMMFVVQTDKMDTSACIISPQHANFLINGKGVEKRCNGNMDTGSQLPTDVTKMLKYGTNLLQAVGQFTGHYLIAIAFASPISQLDHPVLEDYVPIINKASESDLDIIEGQSRITLNCPISHSRIKIPVKGQLCRHLQCFDFSNFVEINSRRPSWRCPYCNQYVCYSDIRFDQNIAKILKEVGNDVAEVMISADGSWKAIMDSNDDSDLDCSKEGSEQQGPVGSPKSVPVFVDLTEDEGEMDMDFSFEQEDRKPPKVDDLTQDVASNPAMPLVPGNAHTASGGAQEEDNFWSGIYRSTFDGQDVANVHEPSTANISNALVQSQFPSSSNMQMQQSQVVSSAVTSEYGNISSLIPGNITRIPNAIQALPAQTQSQNPLQRSSSNVNPVVPGASPTASQTTFSSGLTTSGLRASDMQRHEQLLRSRINASQSLNTTTSLQRSISMQERSSSPGQLSQQFRGHQPSGPLPDLQRPPGIFSEFQNAHLQQTLNSRISMPTTQSPSISRLQRPQAAVAPTSGTGGAQHSRTWASPQQAPHTSTHATPIPLQSPSMDNGSMVLPSEENWRPTGQMRGSLGGRAYSDALSHLIIQPSQNAQATRPSSTPSSNTTAQATGPPSVTPLSTNTSRAIRPPSISPSSTSNAQSARPPSISTLGTSGAQATRPPSITPLSSSTAQVNRLPSISTFSTATAPPHLQHRPPSTISTAPPHLQGRPPSTISTPLSHLQGHSLTTSAVAPSNLQDLSGNPSSAPPNQNADNGHTQVT